MSEQSPRREVARRIEQLLLMYLEPLFDERESNVPTLEIVNVCE
jgi:hypothetical protein